jgi:hypothetical protein
MKKLYLLLFLLGCSIGYLHSQAWYVYDGSYLPVSVNGWSAASSSNPGVNFVEMIIDDAEISGNKILEYVQPDLNSAADNTIKARKYYLRSLSTSDTSNQLTVVTRLRAFDLDSITGEKAFNIEVNDGKNKVREGLIISADDSIISLERAAKSVKVNADLNKWHLYRITFSGIDSTTSIYLDEAATAVLTGKTSSATANNYIRFGDPGTPRVAGLTDWIIIDTTGAYAPGLGASIPDSLSTIFGGEGLPGLDKKVLFLTKNDWKGIDGHYADSMFVVDLQNAGFTVDVAYDEYVTMDMPKVLALQSYNCVIIGRGTASADFVGTDDVFWKKVTTPVILMSNNHVGSNKMNWLPSTVAKYATQLEGPVEGKIKDPSDNAFIGVTIPGDSVITYLHDAIGLISVTPADQLRINGKILISLVNGPKGYVIAPATGDTTSTVNLSTYNKTVLMARWAPLDSMYTGGGGGAVNYGWRSFITGGDDHDYYAGMDKKRQFHVFSPEMNKVLINEILALDTLVPATISDDNALATLSANVGTLAPAFAPATTVYALKVPKGTTSVTITATANDLKATVEGAGEFTAIPGTDTITVTSEAGTPNMYFIAVGFVTDPIVKGIVPPGTGTIDEAILAANDGDTLFLKNDSVYIPISTLGIDKHLVIRAIDFPELPGLDKLPHVVNEFGNTDVFLMKDGGNLELIGVDVDGFEGSATKIISLRTPFGKFKMNINRCRLHDVAGDIIGGNKSDSCTVQNFHIKNSFLYNAVLHGAYIKDVRVADGLTDSKYIWEDVTYWNLGQQFEWFQNFAPVGMIQNYTVDHVTGYNLSTNVSAEKELIGNSDAIGQYNITLSNAIFSTQVSTQPSLMFSTVSPNGTNTLNLRNIVLFDVQPVTPRAGSAETPVTNELNDDPQFADPDNGDFTIGNTAYLTAGDGGSIVGARYWHPDFVDDFSDVSEIVGLHGINSELEVAIYPNPFASEISLSFNLDIAGSVVINIYDVTGRPVKIQNENLGAGSNKVVIKTNELEAGTYFYTIQAGKSFTAGHVLKIK